MLESIVVVFIVAAVALILGRSVYRALAGKKEACHCGGNCDGCASSDNKDLNSTEDVQYRLQISVPPKLGTPSRKASI